MDIQESARRIVEANAPSLDLLDSTCKQMREALWAEQAAARPVKKERHRRGLRRLALSTGAVAAMCAVLVGVNALFPAFAESLPLLGGIFRQVNHYGAMNLHETQENIQAYAQPLAPQLEEPPQEGASTAEPDSPPAADTADKTAPVLTLDVAPNAEWEQNIHITVEEAYYDGYFLFAGLRMEVEENYPDTYDRVYDRQIPGYDLVVNGKGCYTWNEKGGRGGDVPGFATLGYDMWSRTGDREYICQRGFLLPEEYWNQDSLDVELVYKGFFTYDGYASEPEEDQINTSDFTLQFTARHNDAPVREIDCGGISMNGVAMVKALSTPVATLFIVDYENRYVNPAIGDRFSDGYVLGGLGGAIPQDMGNGLSRSIGVSGGMREDEDREVYVTLFDKNGSQQYEAVFLLDFNAGTIQLADVGDIPEIANYAWWDYTDEAGDAWRLESLTVESGEGRWMVSGPTDGYHPLRVEMYQGGKLLDQSENTRSESSRVTYEDEGIDYWIYNGRFWASLDPSLPVDVKVCDAGTGEAVVETTVTLEKW